MSQLKHVDESSLDIGRQLLQLHQSTWATNHLVPAPAGSALDQALSELEIRRSHADDENSIAIDGVFNYDLESEKRRWDRTERIIRRVDPGKYEDANYLEMLARQAATVELQIIESDPNTEIHLGKILFGTIGQPRSEATTRLVGNVVVIELSAGLVTLMYQLAKAAVLASKLMDPHGDAAVSVNAKLDEVQRVLIDNPEPERIVYETIINYIYRGVPKPITSSIPDPEYHPPLTLLTMYAERSVIAHEYGHALTDFFNVIDFEDVDQQLISKHWQREFRADIFSASMVGLSAANQDRVAPNIAFNGSLFAFKVHEILDQVVTLVHGKKLDSKWQSETHPPYEQRMKLVIDAYKDWFEDPEDPFTDHRGMLQWHPVIEVLWDRVRPKVIDEIASDRAVHPIWK